MPTQAAVDAYDLRYGDHERCRLPDGGELYFEVRGENGAPLTFVNNMFMISPLWREFTGRLARCRSLITYDLRNQGASSRIEQDVALTDHVEDLRHLLDKLEIDKTALLGTSVSTLVARDFAVRYPDRVSALILVGPPFSALGSKRRQLIAKTWLSVLETGGPSQLFSMIYPQVLGDRAVHEGGVAGYLALKERFLALNSRQQLVANLSASLTADDDPSVLRGIRCPTLLMAGDGDLFASRSSLDELANLIEDSEVEIIPHAGHLPFVEETEAFEDALMSFFERVASNADVARETDQINA